MRLANCHWVEERPICPRSMELAGWMFCGRKLGKEVEAQRLRQLQDESQSQKHPEPGEWGVEGLARMEFGAACPMFCVPADKPTCDTSFPQANP